MSPLKRVNVQKMTKDEYKRYKWGLLFDYLDKNRDGLLEEEHFLKLAYKLLDMGKTDLGNELYAVYTEVWTQLCDTNDHEVRRTTLSRSEFIRGFLAVAETPWFTDVFIKTLSSVYFDFMDLDHDGHISVAEWREFHRSRDMTDEAVVQATFNMIDTDRNGTISREEYRNAHKEFSLGTDPNNDFSFMYDSNWKADVNTCKCC